MSNKNIEWRVNQIASTLLYRCFGDVSIQVLPDSNLVDWLVTYNDGTDLKFGVMIKLLSSQNKPNTTFLAECASKLDFTDERYRHPIIALFIDELTEKAKVAFLVGWRFGKPQIYKNFELRNLNPESADKCIQIIKSMDSVIRVLSTNDLNILKRINISKKTNDNRVQQAEIVYLRKLSPDYRMNQKEIVDDKERLERLLKDTPEEEFPKDELDEMILEAAKKQFRYAKVHSKLILFSSELDDLQIYKNVHRVQTSLLVSPDLSDISTVELSLLNGTEMFKVNLDVYVENVFYRDAFDGISFDLEKPLNGWLIRMVEWKRMKETMRSVTEYFR